MGRHVWAKVYCDLLRHPLFRGRPDHDVRLVIGLLLEAKEHSEDGVIRSLTADDAKALFHIKAPTRKVQESIDYLVSVGWLVHREGQSYAIKDFVARQAADSPADRMQRWRDAHRDESVTKRNETPILNGDDSVTKRNRKVIAASPEVEEEVEKEEDLKALSSSQANSPVVQVFKHWQAVMGTHRALLDSKREKIIKGQLAAGRTVEELCLAIDGYARDPFHMGKNDRGKKYVALSLIFRDADHVEQFLPASPPNGHAEPQKTKRTPEERMALIEAKFGTA